MHPFSLKYISSKFELSFLDLDKYTKYYKVDNAINQPDNQSSHFRTSTDKGEEN
jgi:hypothetical protein